MHAKMMFKGCSECPFSREARAEAPAARCAECGRETCEGTHARPRPLLVDAAGRDVVTGVEPPREPLVTQGERDAAMEKALSCLIEDLAQWREERATEERERACCDLHGAVEEG